VERKRLLELAGIVQSRDHGMNDEQLLDYIENLVYNVSDPRTTLKKIRDLLEIRAEREI